MRLAILLLGLIALIFVGGFVYFSFTDVPIQQSQISKTISNERFFDVN